MEQLSFDDLLEQARETNKNLELILAVMPEVPDVATLSDVLRPLVEEIRLLRETLAEGLGLWVTR